MYNNKETKSDVSFNISYVLFKNKVLKNNKLLIIVQ